MQTYYAVNGAEIDSNVSGNNFLNKITLGLWDKVGIPRPLSEDDAQIVARILRNYASLQRATRKMGGVCVLACDWICTRRLW